MSVDQFPGVQSYATVATQYTVANAYTVALQMVPLPNPPGGTTQVPVVTVSGALQLGDTQSLFNLNGPPTPTDPTLPSTTAIYTLPGLPYNPATTPNTRLLTANLSSGGTAVICPPDYLMQFPQLANFRGIYLNSVGDFANVQWNGFMWILGTTGGKTVAVASLEQNEL